VEYSLSVGRLPTEIALPEQVRHVPSIVLGTRLPWTISSPPAHALTEKPYDEARKNKEKESEVVFGLDLISEEQYIAETWDSQKFHEDHGPQSVSEALNPSSLILPRGHENQYYAGENINLDYFDVEPVLGSSDPFLGTFSPVKPFK
jgi:hypothetical protein